MNYELLRKIRERELKRAHACMPPAGALLEIGAGAGWQARAFSELGYQVEALETQEDSYREQRVWPVQIYDGRHLPFDDERFDVVFSSNVLEHVPHVEAFQDEIRRVLRPGGVAIHVLPTASWRVYTTLTHYPDLVKRLAMRLRPRRPQTPAGGPRPWFGAPLRIVLVPQVHGTRGNLLSEIYWFSRWRWIDLFRRTGWRVEAVRSVRLCYSGQLLLGGLLPPALRALLSYGLGSSGLVYVLRGEEPG